MPARTSSAATGVSATRLARSDGSQAYAACRASPAVAATVAMGQAPTGRATPSRGDVDAPAASAPAVPAICRAGRDGRTCLTTAGRRCVPSIAPDQSSASQHGHAVGSATSSHIRSGGGDEANEADSAVPVGGWRSASSPENASVRRMRSAVAVTGAPPPLAIATVTSSAATRPAATSPPVGET